MLPQERLNKVELLAKKVSEELLRSAAANRVLREKLTRLESEHKRVKDELRDSKAALARHERLKSRLAKLAEKLERVG